MKQKPNKQECDCDGQALGEDIHTIECKPEIKCKCGHLEGEHNIDRPSNCLIADGECDCKDFTPLDSKDEGWEIKFDKKFQYDLAEGKLDLNKPIKQFIKDLLSREREELKRRAKE